MSTTQSPVVVCGYRPGIIGRIAEMHACYYSRHAGFGQFFESRVASGVAEFTGRLSSPRNGLWAILDGDRLVGSIAVDGEDLGGDAAHLRWFILDEGYRGQGLGRVLMAEAMTFCDKNCFPLTRLWTLSTLSAARTLYERFGFTLEEEFSGTQWGKEILEQVFVRTAHSSATPE